MNALTLALYDIETSNNPFPNGKRLPLDEVGFAFGIVRMVRYHRKADGQVGRGRLWENVHFGPVPFVDDLLRPWAHAIVGYNALAFDNPVSVVAAVYEPPGIHMAQTPRDPERWRRRLGALGLSPDAARYVDQLPEADAEAYLAKVTLCRDHSRLIPPGAVGLTGKRAEVLATLNGRTFDPLAVLGEITGHPHVAKLDYWREGMTLKPFVVDGEEVSGAAVPRLWGEGQLRTCLDKCRHDLDVLEELMHHAFFGGARARLQTQRLNSSYLDAEGVRHEVPLDAWLSPKADAGATCRYRIPTSDWWDRITQIASDTR